MGMFAVLIPIILGCLWMLNQNIGVLVEAIKDIQEHLSEPEGDGRSDAVGFPLHKRADDYDDED